MDTQITTIETPARKAPPVPRNGVDMVMAVAPEEAV
jgi:hypothetical protein